MSKTQTHWAFYDVPHQLLSGESKGERQPRLQQNCRTGTEQGGQGGNENKQKQLFIIFVVGWEKHHMDNLTRSKRNFHRKRSLKRGVVRRTAILW